MSQPHQEPDCSPQPWQNANWPMFILRTWATSIEVFIRGNFGARYLGLQAAAVLVLAPLYGCVKKVTNFDTMFFYLSMYLALCFVHKQTVRRRKQRNEHCNTYYDGFPVLRKFFPWLKCSEVTFKRFYEPALVIALGVLQIPGDEPLGMYVVIGGLCMGFLSNACSVQEEVRLDDLNDSILDQQALAERLREMRGDRF